MHVVLRANAGRYAEYRYRRGLRAYRRRMRLPLLVVVTPLFAFALGVMFSHRLDRWSLAAGAVLAVAVSLVMQTRDGSPQHVQNWKRGAEGERKTEKALRPLARAGWTIEHDIQREGRANVDHVVTGPNGVFLLETKNLTGTISFEDGVLVTHQFDDPDEVYRYTSLASRVRGQAAELSQRLHAESGHRTWVSAVVVVWGEFQQGLVTHEKVSYIAGERLAQWLLCNGRTHDKRLSFGADGVG